MRGEALLALYHRDGAVRARDFYFEGGVVVEGGGRGGPGGICFFTIF